MALTERVALTESAEKDPRSSSLKEEEIFWIRRVTKSFVISRAACSQVARPTLAAAEVFIQHDH